MSGRRRIVALLAAVAVIALTFAAGNWQSRRGDAKTALQAQWETATAGEPARLSASTLAAVAQRLPQRVRLTGSFVPAATVYLNHRIVDGVPGFFVITALDIGNDAPWILVNRGWMAGDRARPGALPDVDVPAGAIDLQGIAISREPRWLELGDAPKALPGVWQNLDFDAFERAGRHPVAALVVRQTSDTADGLRRDWPPPAAGVERHRGYALQWYSLSLLVALITAVLLVRAWLPSLRR